jgi:hypothetical protein
MNSCFCWNSVSLMSIDCYAYPTLIFISDLCLQKVSQFMTRATRLNEAFSVVRRVPIVRPLLPAAGVNPWPVMSLR